MAHSAERSTSCWFLVLGSWFFVVSWKRTELKCWAIWFGVRGSGVQGLKEIRVDSCRLQKNWILVAGYFDCWLMIDDCKTIRTEENGSANSFDIISMGQLTCFFVLNRKAAKSAKDFFIAFSWSERTIRKTNMPCRQSICWGCLPCVLCRPSSMVHSSSEGIRA